MKPPEPDAAFEISLRPPAFSEFTGQVKVRERLELMVAAAKMQKIIIRSARLLGVEIDPAGAAEIATRTRGTPRTANNLLRWVRDYVQVKAEGKITAELADRALTMLEIDRDGFDQWDKRI